MSERPAGPTPSQTVGPFFAFVLTPDAYGYPAIATGAMATPDAEGERISFEGCILDGDGVPVPDAMVEVWQADGAGRIGPRAPGGANAAWSGFGRAEVDGAGVFRFQTVKPGRVEGRNGAVLAPHIALSIFARGLLKRITTRVYFADEPDANAEDCVLLLVPEGRRSTLMAERSAGAAGPVYRLDIRLQGEKETVFFEA